MSDENDSKTNIYSHGYVSMQKEISDLRTQLEKCEKELFDARQGMFKQSITIEVLTKNINERNAENAALTKKLEAVREWVKLYDPDWDNDINKLKKILDGEGR